MALQYSTIQEDMEQRNKKWVFDFLLKIGVFVFFQGGDENKYSAIQKYMEQRNKKRVFEKTTFPVTNIDKRGGKDNIFMEKLLPLDVASEDCFY